MAQAPLRVLSTWMLCLLIVCSTLLAAVDCRRQRSLLEVLGEVQQVREDEHTARKHEGGKSHDVTDTRGAWLGHRILRETQRRERAAAARAEAKARSAESERGSASATSATSATSAAAAAAAAGEDDAAENDGEPESDESNQVHITISQH